MERFCARNRHTRTIQIDGHTVEDGEVWPLQSGEHIEIFIGSGNYEDEHAVNLMQHGSIVQQCRPTNATDLPPSGPKTCKRFAFNAEAPPFEPGNSALARMPEEIQASIITWFVDQSDIGR